MEIPIEAISLPSKGLLYPHEHPLANAETVEIRCMTARDEDILTSRALIKNGTVLSRLMKGCLINKLVDPDSLITGDRNALLISLRVTGYGADYNVEIECTDCGEKFEHEFDLSKLEIKRLGAMPLEPNTNLFAFQLPMSKKMIHFKLLNGKDEMEMAQESARKKKALKSQIDSTMTSKLHRAIVSVEGETDRGKIFQIINAMRAGDARALRQYMTEVEPDVNMEQQIICSQCGEVIEVDIPLAVSFFYPDL